MRTSGLRLITAAVMGISATTVMASDLEKAPPAFDAEGHRVVPIDIQTIALDLDFDYAAQQVVGKASIVFTNDEAGWPMFDVAPTVTSVSFDGQALDASTLATMKDPDRSSNFRVLKQDAAAGAEHRIELTYELNQGVTFSSGAVRAGFFMSDLQSDGRGFWEQYGPAGFEYDQFQQTINVKLSGVTREHELFVNGELTKTGDQSWTVVYPDYYTTSSFYFHLTDKGRYSVERSEIQGLQATIPLTVYASSQSEAQRGMSDLKGYIKELEGVYGPLAHDQFIAYITSSGGGMEHCGATITSLWALGHEVTHSWFARGVMPANGNAGWIDEAIASWRDNGYPRSSGMRGTRVLGGFTPYRRFTTQDAYTYGASLISDLDARFAGVSHDGQKGMKGILRALFAEKARTTMTVGMFQNFIESMVGESMEEYFNRYVFGRNDSGEVTVDAAALTDAARQAGRHPRPFTRAELEQLR